jgi:hypothetical protein
MDSALLEDAVTTQDTVTMLMIIGRWIATLQPLGLTTGTASLLSRSASWAALVTAWSGGSCLDATERCAEQAKRRSR